MSTPLDAMEGAVQQVLLTPRGPLPTLWHSDGIGAGWDLSDDLILWARPRAVQLQLAHLFEDVAINSCAAMLCAWGWPCPAKR